MTWRSLTDRLETLQRWMCGGDQPHTRLLAFSKLRPKVPRLLFLDLTLSSLAWRICLRSTTTAER